MNDFEGFESANTTPVPDVLFDQLLSKLSGTELKVLLYIIRRTHGFKKATDAISLSQFTDGIKTKEGKQLDKGCGVSNRTAVSKALAKLEEMKCIKSAKGKDPVGDAAVSLYSIHFTKGVVQNAYHRSAKRVPPVVQNAYHGGTNGVPGVVQNAYPQETVLQYTDSQETVKQEESAHAFSETEKKNQYQHDHSRVEDTWACNNWRGAHEGATCADYQAYIDSGAREETPTEPRTPAIKIGEHDGTVHSSIPGTSSRHISHAADLPVVHPLPTTQASQVAIGATDDGHTAAARGNSVGADTSNDHLELRQGQVAIASTPGAATFSPQAASPRQSDSPVQDGAAAGGTPGEPRASGEGVTQEKPKRKRRAVTQAPVQLSLDAARLKEWYDELRGFSTSLSKRSVTAWESLAKKKGTDDKEMFLTIVALIDDDHWLKERKIGVDAYWIEREWENKYIFLQGKKVPLADKKSVDIYTANSQNKEKMARRIEEMKANAARKGIQVPGHHGTN